MLRSAVAVGMVLCVGLTTATIVQTSRIRSLQVQLEQTESELQKLRGPNDGGSIPSSISDETLRRLLAEKEAEYAKLSEQYARLQRMSSRSATQSVRAARIAAAATRRSEVNGPPPPPGRGAWLEQIRQQDPQRYQQIIAQREQRRQQAEQSFQEQLEILDARAQTAATQTEADLATQIADTLTKMNDLRAQMEAARNLPEDDPQRQAKIDQLAADSRATWQQLSQLREQDRTLQLQNLATSLGLQGDSVQTFIESVPQIYQNTRYGQGGGPGGGGRQGWDQGGPPPPPPPSQSTSTSPSPASTSK
jgi:hypothetical protein